MQGRGSEENKAIFEFYYEEKIIVEAKANVFTMADGKINSLQTEITIYTDSGEIYHPRVQLSFDDKTKDFLYCVDKRG